MKQWQHTLLGVFVGMILSAGVFLTAARPRGAPVELLPAPTPRPVMVYVTGAVQRPGVYGLNTNSRAEDAIRAAGGFSPQANAEAVNLAAEVKDGAMIVIPMQGTALPGITIPDSELPGNPAAALLDEPASGDLPAGPVNLNTATQEELETLPGVGERRAQDIIAYREAHNGFQTIEEIQNISGIGPATFERLKSLITVH